MVYVGKMEQNIRLYLVKFYTFMLKKTYYIFPNIFNKYYLYFASDRYLLFFLIYCNNLLDLNYLDVKTDVICNDPNIVILLVLVYLFNFMVTILTN